MDLDYALRVDEPLKITESSSADVKATCEKWKRSNHTCLMIMKHSISDTIRGAMPEKENAKKLLVVAKSYHQFKAIQNLIIVV